MIVIQTEQMQVIEEATQSCIALPASKRVISFSPEIVVHPVEHIDDLSDDEVDASWYSIGDFQRFQDESSLTVCLFQHHQCLGDEDELLTVRGLENQINLAEAEATHRRRREAREFGLAESNYHHPTFGSEMASTYKNLSYKSKMVAYLRGVQDAKFARSLAKSAGSTERKRRTSLTSIFPKQSLPKQLQISPVAA